MALRDGFHKWHCVIVNASMVNEEISLLVLRKPWFCLTLRFFVLQLMNLWFAAFWLVGSWIIPIAAQAIGFNSRASHIEDKRSTAS